MAKKKKQGEGRKTSKTSGGRVFKYLLIASHKRKFNHPLIYLNYKQQRFFNSLGNMINIYLHFRVK